ncbi:cation-translocating P-type ATPase [Paenibacillus radicis (ex Xue et al. 2023)]|uniref:Cation-translocating P-type ATPase n=1 Tax=Paenibacillus radicis (ex Xue et al. 2023) TaxID=2972489 RepID=A0ABT1YB44_9BACL|nr:cation-translocating P-type ATPase [Paenibacillus radicis (ex Xue et al. 2023)]MCR8630411.1 cation-translocating P-type ATPase [Paenibacillus radicis (ex Xue et al. 2023)]
MTASLYKNRFLRVLPGRIRMEICGLQGNKHVAKLLIVSLSACKAVHKVEPCLITGRLLLLYDQNQITELHIFELIQNIEEQICLLNPSKQPDALSAVTELEEVKLEVAAAAIVDAKSELPYNMRVVPNILNPGTAEPKEKVPISLALSMGGLAFLGIKQLIMGRSALARSPAPFYLSAFVSVITGYPFLRRGIQTYSNNKKINSDLLLGTSALALALMRENLVVLAGLSILQYVNWKRSHTVLNGNQEVSLSPEIRRYSEKAGKLGIIASAITWAVTRNPLRAIAVLLAANPRPMTVPAQYAWNQAELVSSERKYIVPEKGSLAQLARTKTMLFEDSSLLFNSQEIEEIQCITEKEEEADKIVCLAASLMEKSNHPWKEDIRLKAKQTCRTIRTAFHLEEEEQGLQGKVNDSRIFIGSCKYLQDHGIDCHSYELKAKRLARNGYEVLFAGKQGTIRGQCLGIIVRHQQSTINEYGSAAAAFIEKGWQLGLLHNSLNISDAAISQFHMDTSWSSLEQGEVIERIAVLQQHGEEVLFVADQEHNPMNQFYKEAGVPSIAVHELTRIQDSALFAEKMYHTVNQHVQITKKWNIFGSVLATLGMISAPVVNLAGDALSLVFMSRTKKISEALTPISVMTHEAEIAAAAEALVWHALPSDQVIKRLQANQQDGLAADQVLFLQNQYGLNRLDSRKPTPWIISYMGQFKEFTTLILLGTTALALLTGGLFDGIAMGAILLANAAIGTIQERKAEKVVQMLNQFQPPMSKCIRDGQQMELSAAELVPGDLICLEAGDRIPADIRLISSWNLRVNEATLTGESLPIEKNDSSLKEDCPLTERTNMLFMGTDVCGGKGKGIVVHTGMNTEMGHLMSLLKQQEKDVTPLQEKVTSISKKFVKGALVAGGLVFVVGMLRGIPIPQMISTSITLAASAIPEGLPVTITIALSAGIFRMAKKNALIRKLSSLETLGRTTIICTDKTGTLTKNEMTVKALSTVDRMWTVTGNGYEPLGTLHELTPEIAASAAAQIETKNAGGGSLNHPDLKRLLQICVLCNNSKLEQQEGQWITKGDPTEGALLTLAAKNGMWLKDMAHWHRGLEIPFDSNTAKMSVVCKDLKTEQECYLFSKGAVETILRRCNRYQSNGEILPLSEEQKQQVLQQNEKFSADALRVLAFAYRPIDGNVEHQSIDDEQELIYVGIAGMIDPPRSEVEQNIREAFALGVIPVMITGDHPITALAIAKQLGIYNGTQKIVSGYELDRWTDEELNEIVDEVSIFARVTPEHKLRIVTAFQKRGHIVAMTGDGVNDTPAIKQANVGIAMGRTGTEVTKETADMVLTEDHFGTIVDGVKEGRTIIGNIRKALGCLLTGNLAEIIVTSAAVMVGLPIPLVPIQILLMNLLTDALPAMVLAVNPGNKTKQTKRTDIVDKELYQKVITKGVLLGLGSLGLFAASLAAGIPMPVAQSIAFATLVAGQLIQTFSWRQEGSEETVRDWTKDRFLLGALCISWLALIGALYFPPLAVFFHTAPLPLKYWIPILGVAGSISILSKPILALISKKQELKAFHASHTFTAA